MLNPDELIDEIELFEKLDFKYVLEELRKNNSYNTNNTITLDNKTMELIRNSFSILVKEDNLFAKLFQKALENSQNKNKVADITISSFSIETIDLFIILFFLAPIFNKNNSKLTTKRIFKDLLNKIDNNKNKEKNMKLKILLISSNPHRNLSLNEECRTIEQAIQIATHRNSIEVIPKLATRIEDFFQALNEIKPHIVHFTGHGNENGELLFTNEKGMDYEPISINALKNLFKTTKKDNIKLVFLDACYSKIQGETIVSEIDYVIGMNSSILETTATTFARAFYNSLSTGRTIKEAFAQAKVMLEIKHPKELNIPELLIKDGLLEDIKISDIVNMEEKPNISTA